jgi:hypothetical protein
VGSSPAPLTTVVFGEQFTQLFPGLRVYEVIFLRVLPSDLVFVFVLSHRLNGIGSTPSSPDCTTWDNWSVSHSAICLTLSLC